MKIPFEEFGNGRDIVLLHAFPLSRKMWQPNINSLVDAGFHIITPDLRGFGANANFADINLMEDMAKDIAELLDSLEIEKAIIGGLSMSGYVVFELLRLYPERFSALILCDTTFEADSEDEKQSRYDFIKQIEKNGMSILVENMLPKLLSIHTKSHNKTLVENLKREFFECPLESAVAALEGMAQRDDHSAVLDKIDIPTLLVFGEFDTITDVETAEQMKDKISDAELTIIKNAGHYSNLENPAEFNSALIEFASNYNL